ncbi:MAG TPA: ABC transporter substrate-binding protein, partial [Solirubrobacteraceae bacterium]|nr:ABC transporter substrate-binding protein [Solirubrobacteraceae bacterium]
ASFANAEVFVFKNTTLGQAVGCLLIVCTAVSTGCGASHAPAHGVPVAGHAGAPLHIVSLSATATESLFAIGAGDRVVAVDDQSNYPAGAPHSKLSSLHPSAEAVAAYRPDLVVTTGDDSGFVASLHALRIPVLVQPPARSLGEAYAQIEHLGATTGRLAAARRILAAMRRRIAALVASVRPVRATSVYHELSPDSYSASSDTFIGAVYRLFGLRDIADGAHAVTSGYPQLSREYVLRANPGLIVLADVKCCAQSARTLTERPGWKLLRAVRDGAVVAVDDDIASRWGPRTVEFVAAIARVLRHRGG